MSAASLPCGEFSRALVIKLRHHGDVLLTSPVFTVLKQVMPACQIDALVYAETAPMLDGHPAITQVHTIDRRAGKTRIGDELRLFSTLRAQNYDLLIHLTESWRGAWLARFLRPRCAVATFSPIRPPAGMWRRAFTHLAPLPPLGNRHTVDCHLDSLRRLGIRPRQEDMPLVFVAGAAAEARIDAVLTEHGLSAGDWVHLHPASRWMFKAWTIEGYVELIDRLAERGLMVVMTTGPDARETAFAAEIRARCHATPVDLSGKLSLKELGALIARARLSICVDSVPMHLAAAVGTPVIALFGPSNEREWGPWRVPHRIVSTDFSCRPCRLDGCGGGKVAECLVSLTTNEVMAAVESLLIETEER